MRNIRWLTALLLVFTLIAAACSASDDDSETATDAEETTEATDEAADDTAEDTEDTTESEEDGEEMADGEPAEVATDFGVTDDAIKLGISGDLSGPFAALVTAITEATTVYFEQVNAEGGIAGRQVELEIIDSGYDVNRHLDNYAELSEESDAGVVMITQSTGSPHTSAIAGDLIADDMIAIPLSWYSGWATDFGANVFEMNTNYCLEAMNAVEYVGTELVEAEAPSVAIVSLPGEYGQDGAAGAKIAAEQLGFEVVYDGEGAIAGEDLTPIVQAIMDAEPDLVFLTTTPAQTSALLGETRSRGLEALWTGSSPSFSAPVHLAGDLAQEFSDYYFHSAYAAAWDSNDSPGMQDLVGSLVEAAGDLPMATADNLVAGWVAGIFAQTVLEKAAENGDMTRAGVVAAANEVSVDFQGLQPNQEWFGEPNDFVVRASYIFDVDVEAADLANTIADGGGTGLIPLAEEYVGSVAADYQFDEPCFVSEG